MSEWINFVIVVENYLVFKVDVHMQNKFLSSCDIMWIMNEYHDNYKWHKGYIITNFWVSE